MFIWQTVPDIRGAMRTWLHRRWRAQLVDLNHRIARLECVRDEARAVRTRPSEADRRLLAVRSLVGLRRQRQSLARRLNIPESRAACIMK